MTGSPPVRRIVTGHDEAGRAVFTADDLLPVTPIPSGDAAFSLIWTTASVPADNNDDSDGRSRDAGLTLHQGSVIRIVDMLPGGVSPFHRSSSIDYGIVLSGAVELELDDGAVTTAHAGDIIVQRGTIHLWRNPSASENCRIAFVLIEAAPRIVDGKPLPDIMG
ncbi:cupin domain-containing protein [Blastomonas sp. UPD001]|jgi:quercetin dioxygenase-like cupin family protein|uniref:cupin domain-containing protein n=1 Tax=unclassified Blastomonas TaxID=2626550 RepID=UPI000E350C2E|nr:cupin domain-containing protein [Blastomonas sp. UPD001]MBL0966797.1 cupin domain-containing protein [Blastomonas sp.]